MYIHCDPAKLPLSPRAPVPQILGHSPLSQQGDVFEGVHQGVGGTEWEAVTGGTDE